jgi:Uma2 family endonuclease
MAAPHIQQTFTVAEYQAMAEQGVFGPTERVELIDGEIIWMSPIGSPHADIVDALNILLIAQIGHEWLVRVQNAVMLGNRSQPQPDISVVVKRRYRSALPDERHVRLLIEVSDSTLPFDRNVKLPVYAAAGVPETWVVDVQAEIVTRHSEISAGHYTQADRFGRGERITSHSIASLALDVDDIFGTDEE